MTKKTEKKVGKIAAWAVLAMLVLWCYTCMASSPGLSPQEKEKKEVLQWFGTSGEHIRLVSHVKQTLRDPKSFQHVVSSYSYTPGGKTVTVTMEYRAANAFGGLVPNVVKAECERGSGAVLRIIAE